MIRPLDRLLLSQVIDCLEESDELFEVHLEDGTTTTIFLGENIDLEALITILKRVLGVN